MSFQSVVFAQSRTLWNTSQGLFMWWKSQYSAEFQTACLISQTLLEYSVWKSGKRTIDMSLNIQIQTTYWTHEPNHYTSIWCNKCFSLSLLVIVPFAYFSSIIKIAVITLTKRIIKVSHEPFRDASLTEMNALLSCHSTVLSAYVLCSQHTWKPIWWMEEFTTMIILN